MEELDDYQAAALADFWREQRTIENYTSDDTVAAVVEQLAALKQTTAYLIRRLDKLERVVAEQNQNQTQRIVGLLQRIDPLERSALGID